MGHDIHGDLVGNLNARTRCGRIRVRFRDGERGHPRQASIHTLSLHSDRRQAGTAGFRKNVSGEPPQACASPKSAGESQTRHRRNRKRSPIAVRFQERTVCFVQRIFRPHSSRFSAAPRMSPSDAPESEEPYCWTASFSSAISRALIDRPSLRFLVSALVTRTSILSPF